MQQRGEGYTSKVCIRTISSRRLGRRLENCHWTITHHDLRRYIVSTGEAEYIPDGVNNTRNSHFWSDVNPQGTVEANFPYRFSADVWWGITDGQFIGSFFLEGRLTGAIYAGFFSGT
jgi:hypothetical protein